MNKKTVSHTGTNILRSYSTEVEPTHKSKAKPSQSPFKNGHGVISHRSKLDNNVNSLVKSLICWCKDSQAPMTPSIKSLCEGALPKKNSSSLRAILAAYQPETFLIASDLLTKFENFYGPVPDVLISAQAVRSNNGYIMIVRTSNGTVTAIQSGGVK
ncbi:MAG: hypothetical protein E6Q34_11960 [Burkholderiaceae bacterium]|nr:MAG: hypothetical protein E6Q34_11960 [Burkholderiaceae bacterium]